MDMHFWRAPSATITSGLLAGHGFTETVTAPATDITKCTLVQGTVAELNAVYTFTVL